VPGQTSSVITGPSPAIGQVGRDFREGVIKRRCGARQIRNALSVLLKTQRLSVHTCNTFKVTAMHFLHALGTDNKQPPFDALFEQCFI
jgi:hypothetical protein